MPVREPADGGCRPDAPRPGNGRLAFSANATTDINSDEINAPGDVYTATTDGDDVRRLTDSLDSTFPAWSPDGERIAYVRTAWRHNYENALWVMNADGSGKQLITEIVAGPGGGLGAGLDWSPGGKRIAFGSGNGVSVVDIHTQQTRVLPWRVRRWDSPWSPRWSADGRHLAVAATGRGRGPDEYTRKLGVFTIDSTTGGEAAKAPGVKNLMGHDWSQVHCRMVYAEGLQTRGGECNGDLHVTGADLVGPGPLPSQPCRQAAPVWSPDGRQIAYASAGGIWIADADGTDAHEAVRPLGSEVGMVGGPGALVGPDWQPIP